jgi:hypothetical protein
MPEKRQQQQPQETPAAMPTPEDQAKMQAVANAGAKAAAEAPPGHETDEAKEAMKAERDRQQLPMTDQELDRIADLFVSKTIQQFEERGAFDPPAEPVAPAVPREAPAAPGREEAGAAQAEAADAAPVVPQKRSFAQRFMGAA